MYNRYYGNTGRVERVGTPQPRHDAPPPPPPPERSPPGPPGGLSGELFRGLLRRIAPGNLETEDLLLLAVLYLLYRECGDREFLLAIAAYLFF